MLASTPGDMDFSPRTAISALFFEAGNQPSFPVIQLTGYRLQKKCGNRCSRTNLCITGKESTIFFEIFQDLK